MKYTVALLFLLVASSAVLAQKPGRRDADEQRPGGRREAEEQKPGRREAEEQRPGGRREADEQRPGGRREAEDKQVLCGPVCAVFCPFGQLIGSNGCPTCACNPSPLGDLLCAPSQCKNCFYGQVTWVENNCKRCRCKTLTEALNDLLG